MKSKGKKATFSAVAIMSVVVGYPVLSGWNQALPLFRHMFNDDAMEASEAVDLIEVAQRHLTIRLREEFGLNLGSIVGRVERMAINHSSSGRTTWTKYCDSGRFRQDISVINCDFSQLLVERGCCAKPESSLAVMMGDQTTPDEEPYSKSGGWAEDLSGFERPSIVVPGVIGRNAGRAMAGALALTHLTGG